MLNLNKYKLIIINNVDYRLDGEHLIITYYSVVHNIRSLYIFRECNVGN
jgi:hypothetical protein